MVEAKSPIKATLTIVLNAGNVQVAESSDPGLWQRVLAAISAGPDPAADSSQHGGNPPGSRLDQLLPTIGGGGSGQVGALAKEIGVPVDKLIGAISPSLEEPYIHLDLYVWSAWAKHNPARGPNSVSPTALAATLLALWFRKANLGTVTVEQAQSALQTANVNGQNPTRSIKNSRWLQLRGNSQVVLNPARIADAIEIARGFCASEKPKFSE